MGDGKVSLINLTAKGRFVTDEKTKTVTIRQAEYTLQKDSFLPGYHLVIYASSVTIKKGYKNPGCNLSIYAAQIIVDEKGGKIDISGTNGMSYKAGDRAKAHGYKPGTHNGVNGIDGKKGGTGQNSGILTINAGTITGGQLEILATGGNGGRAQDGGHAVDGAKPPQQGTPKRPKINVKEEVQIINGVIYTTKIKTWGDDVKEFTNAEKNSSAYGIGSYLLVTSKAKKGKTGGNGGHAGLPGISGDGGKGATITINTLAKPAIQIAHNIIGGEAAPAAQFGTPGKAASGGLGAKYLFKAAVGFVSADWSTYDEKNFWENHWSNGVHIKNLKVTEPYITTQNGIKVLSQRNSTGKTGNKGGYGEKGTSSIPSIPHAIKGSDGSIKTNILKKPQLYKNIPYAYFVLLQRSATIALINKEQDSAITVLQWLIFLTTPFKNLPETASAEAKQSQLIYYESETTLLTINREQNKNRAKRCIYKDIDQYADFVEASLTHVRLQSKFFNKFQQALEAKNQQKKALKDAIAESQLHITQLIGDSLTPGSIVYFKKNEKQIKAGLGDLDLQLLNYKIQLNQMPTDLQNEIDAEYYKKTQISFWNVLEYFSMAAGIVINFASAASSIAKMVGTVKEFYKEAMELSSWADILKEGIWNREFTQLKDDLNQLIETSEFKKMSKDGKAFITSVTDFQGKILAYDELLKSRKIIDLDLDILDIQASVLNFDMAKLKLKKQRTELEASLRKLLDEHKTAQQWQHTFTDYFDTSITRFDMLAHLADIQAQRHQLENQRNQYQRNIETQQAELDRLNLNTNDCNYDAASQSLEANMSLALNQSLQRIKDEYRAYRIWTLNDVAFPKMQQNISVESLSHTYHNPIWERIKDRLSSKSPPSNRDFSDTPFRKFYSGSKEDFNNRYYDKTNKLWRFMLTLPTNFGANIYFLRLINTRIFLSGARIAEGSAFHCILRHRGISRFINKDRQKITVFQNKRSIEFSYIVEDDEPNYDYPGAIKTSFDDPQNWRTRIHYSPFTTWELEIIPNYKQNASSRVYNKDIDFSGLKSIELRYSAYFNSFVVDKKVKPKP